MTISKIWGYVKSPFVKTATVVTTSAVLVGLNKVGLAGITSGAQMALSYASYVGPALLQAGSKLTTNARFVASSFTTLVQQHPAVAIVASATAFVASATVNIVQARRAAHQLQAAQAELAARPTQEQLQAAQAELATTRQQAQTDLAARPTQEQLNDALLQAHTYQERYSQEMQQRLEYITTQQTFVNAVLNADVHDMDVGLYETIQAPLPSAIWDRLDILERSFKPENFQKIARAQLIKLAIAGNDEEIKRTQLNERANLTNDEKTKIMTQVPESKKNSIDGLLHTIPAAASASAFVPFTTQSSNKTQAVPPPVVQPSITASQTNSSLNSQFTPVNNSTPNAMNSKK